MEIKAKGKNIRIVKMKGSLPENTIVKKRADADFWKEKTLEELAKEQGIGPITDVNSLFGYWPEDADFESFYDAAVNSRKHAKTS